MKPLTYSKFIMDNIADIPFRQPFETGIIALALAQAYALPIDRAKPIINVNLKRLADRGAIERFRKGVYYRAQQTVFGKARPSEDVLEAQLLTRAGDQIIGYETGLFLMNKLGITTLVPKKREIVTNAYRRDVSDQYTTVRKPVVAVNADNYRYLQLLDMVRDLSKTPVDAQDPKDLLRAFAKNNGLNTMEALTYAKKYYPKRTWGSLVDLLVRGNEYESA